MNDSEEHWYLAVGEYDSKPGIVLVHMGCTYSSPDIALWSLGDVHKAVNNHMREWHDK